MARQVVDGVWLLELGLVAPLASNAYLVDDGTVTLVDAGLPYNYPRLGEELGAAGYARTDVDRVLLTHYDLDHVGGLARLGGAPPTHLGERDVDLLRGAADGGLHHKGLFHRGLRRLFDLGERDLRRVADGDRIGGFEAFHTPGHNPGHTAFVHEELSAAFLGDLVWEDDGGLTPPFWLDSYDMREVRRSIRGFAARTPAFEAACMGHGTPFAAGGSDRLRALADRL